MFSTHLISRRLLLAGLAIVVAASTAAAQRGSGMGTPRYDTATEATISGTVTEVQTHQGRMNRTGVHLVVQTTTGTTDVHVAPTTWLQQQHIEFAKGDTVTVVGSFVTIDGTKALLAREITRGTTTIVLRDQSGRPEWARARGRRQS